MATATERSKGTGRGATRASRSNTNGSSSSPRKAASKQGSKARTTRGRAAGAASSGRTAASRSKAEGRSASAKSAKRAPTGARSDGRGGSSRNGHRGNGTDIGKQVGISAATGTVSAALGLAGGVLLGRTAAARRPKKVLGVKLPTQPKAEVNGLGALAKSVNDAGRQFGKLAGEVRQARQKAEDVGRALS